MAKSNYIKVFIRLKDNFQTTKFLYNKYLSVNEKYMDLEYNDFDFKNEIKKKIKLKRN